MSLLTGIPLLIVVKYLFVVKALVVTPIVEKVFRSFFNQHVAYLATALFLASPGAILFPHKESFAVIFFFLAIYASIKTEKTRQYVLIGLLSVLTLIMTHHFSTYIFLGLLSSLFLASRFYKRQKAVRVSSQFFLLCLIVFTAWVAFIAWTTIAIHQKLLSKVFFESLLPGKLTYSELLPLYSPYERIIVWLGIGITLVSTGIGFLLYTRNRRRFSSSFFAMTLFFVPLLAVATIFRFSSSSLNIHVSHRAYEFGYIIVGTFSALFFIRTFQSKRKPSLNVIVIGAIVVVILVGPLVGAMHPRTFARVSRVLSSRAISLNVWLSESGATDEYAIVDSISNLILAGYGDSLVIEYPEFFASQDFNLPWDVQLKSSYVVTFRYMKDFYGPNIKKFDTSPFFQHIYNDGILDVYGISNRISSQIQKYH